MAAPHLFWGIPGDSPTLTAAGSLSHSNKDPWLVAAPCPKLLDKCLGTASPAAAAQGQLMWALGAKNHGDPPACPSWSQWGGNAGAGGEIPTEGLGCRVGPPFVEHRTPGSSQRQNWGELRCPTPLGDLKLQPGTPERGSAKLLLLLRGREGMLGPTPAATRKHGTLTPFLPHTAEPLHVPLPSLPLPQEDTSTGQSTVQPPRPAAETGTAVTASTRVRGSNTGAEPGRSRAGLGTGDSLG